MAYIAPVPITHSSVVGSIPSASLLEPGALAVNVVDGALYTKDYFGATVRIEGDAGNSSIGSASSVNLGAVMASMIDISGTTAITSITLKVGQTRFVRFLAALTLTNGASLILPGGANITTAAGDFAMFRGYASGVVRCVMYSSGGSLASSVVAATSKTTPVDADLLALVDSAASNVLKKLTWANLKATLATWLNGGTIPVSATTLAANLDLTLSTAVTTSYHGIVFTSSGTDAYIKQLPNTGELAINSGRGAAWGGHIKIYTDTTLRALISNTAITMYLPLNVGGQVNLTSGNLVVSAGSISSSGAFGVNGSTPQGKSTVSAACTDLATAITLINQLRTTLINNGIAV